MDFVKLIKQENQRRRHRKDSKPSSDVVVKPSDPQSELLPNPHSKTLFAEGHVLDRCAHRVGKSIYLAQAWYCRDFLSSSQSDALLQQLYQVSTPWQTLKSRRALRYQHNKSEQFPDVIASLAHSLSDRINVKTRSLRASINHVLINEYMPGEGILPHTDGDSYEPLVMTISLLSSTIIRFNERLCTDEIGKRQPKEIAQFVLEPRSLFAFAGDLYDKCLHRIDAVVEEEVGGIANRSLCATPALAPSERIVRGKRVSLTFRIKRPVLGDFK